MKRKQAFSLTELLIVLVIVAILFAALAPVLTKRRLTTAAANESVWNYVSFSNDQKDVYFDPGNPKWSSTLFVGIDPNRSNIQNDSLQAKMAVRAKKYQAMMQFRYGEGDGRNVGSLFLDDKKNQLVSTVTSSEYYKNYNGTSNTVFGSGAFQRLKGNNLIAFGANALRGNDLSDDVTNEQRYTMIGANAGKGMKFKGSNDRLYYSSRGGIAIGSNSNLSEYPMYNDVAVGAYSKPSQKHISANGVYIGYNVGAGVVSGVSDYPNGNILLGTNFFGPNGTSFSPQRNVIVGYSAYTSGNPTNVDMVAVGGKTCKGFVSSTNAPISCIGYSSGSGRTRGAGSRDYEQILLGGAPVQTGSYGFAGRSVLEVHNPSGIYSDFGFGNSSVVLNSNLVLRGNMYLTLKPESRFMEVKYRTIGHSLLNKHCVHDRYFRIGRRYRCRLGGRDKEQSNSRSYMSLDGSSPMQTTSSYPTILVKSDARLKENITLNNDGLSKILSLKPYNFTFKDDKNKVQHVGVIAQDLAKIFPNAVTKHEDGFLRIRWEDMFYAAINAIKTLDVKIQKIASNISTMEQDVKNIKAKHKDIHKNIVLLNSRVTRLEK